ncbi:class III extradiol dioxygenase subunit B-like domain-containing protein [Spirillospora sp. NPDC052242]
MIVSAAVCPHPPLLVPAMAGGAAPELDGLRAACDEAVGRLAAARPDVLVVVGGAPDTAAYGDGAYATLRPYGLPWTSPEVPEEGGAPLPLSLTIGRWLVERAAGTDARGTEAGGTDARVRYRSVVFDAPPGECLALGRELAGSAERVALLVMGDGSACRSEKAPGYLDERAGPYDEAVARALGKADAAALAALDPGTSRELRAAGRAAWQVLAGAAAAGRFTGELLADEAPYGVGYLVASWTAAPGR